MKDKKTEGNVAMIVSKTISGLNSNALKYLIPVWIAPLTAVTYRLVFGAIAFWVTDIVITFIKTARSKKSVGKTAKKADAPSAVPNIKSILQLMLLGSVCSYGFMALYLSGLKYTTPVSSSIIFSLVPIWVFFISVAFYKEKLTMLKISGILMGLGGALISMTSKRDPQLASDALLGDLLTLACSVVYAFYLIYEGNFLKKFSNMTVLKWTFTGAAITALIVDIFIGFESDILKEGVFGVPMLVLAFVLIGPTYISYLLLPVGLKYLNTTVVSMYGYIVIVIASITAYILGQDKFSWLQIISIIFLCGGVFLVEKAEKSAG